MISPNHTHIAVLVDRSGSMKDRAQDAEGGLSAFIEDQRSLPDLCTITLYQFDSEYDQVYGPVSINEAPAYKLQARGGTALLDAMGRSINETGQWLGSIAEDKRPSKVIFIVVTDGGENSSKEYTRTQITDLIAQQHDVYKWDFAFMSSDMSAVGEAQALGIPQTSTTNFPATSAGYAGAYGALSNSVLRSRTTGEEATFTPSSS